MCSVFLCGSSRRGAQRFKLPKDPEKRLEWVQFVFEANCQRLKESSWTDITICREHFTEDCFGKTKTGAVQMRSSAVPSLCIKSEPEEEQQEQEPVPILEFDSQYEQQQSDSSEESISPDNTTTLDVPVSPVPSQTPEEDYVQMLRKVQNVDIIREKAALLQKKGRYVVNENQLLQLFGSRCPLCDSNVKMEKIIHGGLIIVKRQCLQCKYRHQWKSLIGVNVQGAEGQHLSYESKLISESEESDRTNETEDSSDPGPVDSDEDWKPAEQHSLTAELHNGSDETEDDDGEEVDNYYVFAPNHSELCTECGKFFSKRWPHTCEHKVKPYSCNICGKRCVSEVALNRHSRVHNENYEHRCKYCHRTFKTKVDKITHQQIHVTEGKPYKCPDCPETFASNKDREIHLEDHRGPKQLTCPFCGIEFNRTLSIQRHLMVHTGQKPFKCSVCQRGFNQASHLKSHMRLHTGERPFKCPQCDKCFNHNVSLKSHIQRYHTSNPAHERKRGRKSKTVSTDETDSQEKCDERGAEPVPGPGEEHDDEEEPIKKKRKLKPKSKRSTGRPIGRPKRNAEGHLEEENQELDSNTETGTSKARKSKTTGGSDEESEDEPPESNMSYDSHDEEDFRSEKVTSSPSRSRGSPRMSDPDPDTDFDPEDSKEEKEEQQIEQWNQLYKDVKH
ncbi:zinc finger protein 678-like isoform X2 [Hippoglossus hippoglossus]|uniref:zinc finger protein 678-like isoform X2 n=1 Tax=Hippoglossus hippoglossus TaxID=8267 RepID=UPI00148B34AF|nr:zinc finger protein 678-like isoform X2 [Hippoglossus hippoglossus]